MDILRNHAPNRITEPSKNGTGRKPAKPKAERPTKAAKEAAAMRGRWALVCGAGGVIGLALSAIDSTIALHQLTNVNVVRCAMLAIVIDGLLVGASVAEILAHEHKHIRRWCLAYIVLAGLLSVVLNSFEFSAHSTGTLSKAFTATIGATIPVLVLMADRFASHLWLSSREAGR